MAGELNGTAVIITNSTGAIVGQGEMSMTFNGSPIDISNKSTGDFIVLLDGELAAKQLVLTGTLVYNDDTQYRKVRADSLVGTADTYTLTYVSASTTTDETFAATMIPNGLSDAIPHGDKVSTSITFSSSGAVTHTPAA